MDVVVVEEDHDYQKKTTKENFMQEELSPSNIPFPTLSLPTHTQIKDIRGLSTPV